MVQLVSVGKSGRVVIEIEPEFKKELYQALGEQGKSLKAWFLENAQIYLDGQNQANHSEVKKFQKEVRNVQS